MCTDLDLGTGLLERWAASRQVAASGEPRTLPWRKRAAVSSSVFVHRVRQHAHGGDDAFYAIENLYVDPGKRVRVSASPTGGPRLSIQRGAFRVSCRPAESWATAPAPLTLASIKGALAFGALPPVPIDPMPTLFVARDGAANVFHALTDLFNAYQMLRLFPYERIVVLDDHEDGPLMALWQRLCPRALVRFAELGDARILSQAAFSPPGGCCLMWKNHWAAREECRRESPLLQAFRGFVLERLGLVAEAPPARGVTLVRRRTGAGGPVNRRIANEDALVAALSRIGAEVEVVDFAELPYEAQIRRVLDTRVLIGATGAGLSNLLWLDGSAAVVEIVAVPSYAPACFANLAAWRGVRYASWRNDGLTSEQLQRRYELAEVAVDERAIAALVATLLD